MTDKNDIPGGQLSILAWESVDSARLRVSSCSVISIAQAFLLLLFIHRSILIYLLIKAYILSYPMNF